MSMANFKLQSRRSGFGRLREQLAALSERFDSRRARAAAGCALVALAIGGGVWYYVATRPVVVPKVLVDDLEDSLNFMLLSDEFNRLPLKQRRDLLKDLVARMKGMDSGDSALMASFAAGIMGPARAQLQKNAEKLMVDQWDEFARDYTSVPKAKRGEFLDKSLVEMTKMMEDIGGFTLPVKEEDRAAMAKKDAKRNQERNGGRVTKLDDNMAMGAAGAVVRGSELASPKQKARMSLLMRDMTRHLRGEDVDSGKPIEPPPAPEDKDKDKEPKPEQDPAMDPNQDPNADPNAQPASPSSPAPGTPPAGPG
ncbi:MAG: hypothetical protein K2X32_14365 [Phycisphaerales bacterium]|nr:hypothetical protein [Phycisphaerales bacterium]